MKGEYRLELPTDLRFDRVPEKTSIHSEFGEFEVEYSLQGNVPLAKQTLSFVLTRIPPGKYAEFRDFVNASLRAESQRLRVRKVSP